MNPGLGAYQNQLSISLDDVGCSYQTNHRKSLKKLKGHIALDLSVRAFVPASSVRYKFKIGF